MEWRPWTNHQGHGDSNVEVGEEIGGSRQEVGKVGGRADAGRTINRPPMILITYRPTISMKNALTRLMPSTRRFRPYPLLNVHLFPSKNFPAQTSLPTSPPEPNSSEILTTPYSRINNLPVQTHFRNNPTTPLSINSTSTQNSLRNSRSIDPDRKREKVLWMRRAADYDDNLVSQYLPLLLLLILVSDCGQCWSGRRLWTVGDIHVRAVSLGRNPENWSIDWRRWQPTNALVPFTSCEKVQGDQASEVPTVYISNWHLEPFWNKTPQDLYKERIYKQELELEEDARCDSTWMRSLIG